MFIHVGRRIEELMKLKGATNKDLSAWLDIGESAISRLLDRQSQKTDHLYSLSANTGIPVEAFVSNDLTLSQEVKIKPVKIRHSTRRSLVEVEALVAQLEERATLLQAMIADKDQVILLYQQVFHAFSLPSPDTKSDTKRADT